MSGTTKTIDETRAFVRTLFAGVLDKGGVPYAEHCERVEQYLGSDASADERHAALLHDVVEDTPISPADLASMGYSDRVCQLVSRLTRPDAGTYMAYIRGIAESGDSGLIRVKLADNTDNSDPARIAALPPEQQGIAGRYGRARTILVKALQKATREAHGPPVDA